MKEENTLKKISGLGILAAMVIVFQLLANFVKFGPVNITLALIPIVVGTCVYGPLSGFFLGLINGFLILFSPDTFALFFPASAIGTIITCLSKTAIAGLVSGLVFKLLKEKHPYVGIILASILVPIINTGMFVIYCFMFFMPVVESFASQSGTSTVEFLFLSFIGINFIIEFIVNSALSPAVYQLYKIFLKNN